MTVTTPKCERCDHTFWVYEAHTDVPSDIGLAPRAHAGGAPGMPCPSCNRDDPPKMLPGFTATIDG